MGNGSAWKQIPDYKKFPGFEEFKKRGITTLTDLVDFCAKVGVYRISIRTANQPKFWDGATPTPEGTWEVSMMLAEGYPEWGRSGDVASFEAAMKKALGVPVHLVAHSATVPVPVAEAEEEGLLV